MELSNYIFGAGVAVLVVYFVRRMYWLSMTNRHNLVTDEPEVAKKDLDKAHDLLSWAMLGAESSLILGSALF